MPRAAITCKTRYFTCSCLLSEYWSLLSCLFRAEHSQTDALLNHNNDPVLKKIKKLVFLEMFAIENYNLYEKKTRKVS